ncbi:sce7725 family protein [Mitsuaria sp. GD03876]|uniref:sce7725 family protein n=1 Tax=Mitsuaria sp. GD03876 TaxID=2975399 RepID=UPI002447BA64|nr:sce7725 family protein [Mitsuaria sp. GD03876]MDH0864892.1 sce7725 family protein [Mitsuaria sp. GD03876]
MYYPYLHGKQKEVLALRHLAPVLGAEGQLQPVLEPVRQAATSMRHTLEACEAHRLQVWLVVNPVRQDFELLRPSETLEWGRQLFTSLSRRQWIHPTLMLGPALTPEVVRRFVQLFGSRPLGLVVGADAPPLPDVMALLGGAQVRRVFFKDSEPAPAARAALGGAGCVWVENRRLPETHDLRVNERHLFTDRAASFRAAGLAGFSDYTTLPSRPEAPELPSRTIAFRLSFLRQPSTSGEVWIEHFMNGRCSAEEGGPDARFRYALQAFHAALDRTDACFGPTEAVRRYLTSLIDGSTPSRALSKQWEVMHHLELVSGMLAGRFPAPRQTGRPESLLERSPAGD